MFPWVAGAAFGAAPGALTPQWEVGSVRSLKIDAFRYDVITYPSGWAWAPTDLEQFTTVLVCTVTGPKRELCTFPQGLWVSVVVGGKPLRTEHTVAPPQIELAWTTTGKLAHWDFQGDRTAFADGVTAAYVKLTWNKPDTQLSADARREFGLGIEDELGDTLADVLDWELPRSGGPPYTWSVLPRFGRRWTQSVANGKVQVTAPDLVAATPGDRATERLELTGEMRESNSDIGTLPCAVVTQIAGVGTFDRKLGRIVGARIEALQQSGSAACLVGPTHFAAIVVPWKDGDPVTPLARPPSRFTRGP